MQRFFLPFSLFLTGLNKKTNNLFKMIREIVSEFINLTRTTASCIPFAIGHDPKMFLIDRMKFKFETTKSRKCNNDLPLTTLNHKTVEVFFDRTVPLCLREFADKKIIFISLVQLHLKCIEVQ